MIAEHVSILACYVEVDEGPPESRAAELLPLEAAPVRGECSALPISRTTSRSSQDLPDFARASRGFGRRGAASHPIPRVSKPHACFPSGVAGGVCNLRAYAMF